MHFFYLSLYMYVLRLYNNGKTYILIIRCKIISIKVVILIKYSLYFGFYNSKNALRNNMYV